MNKRAIFYKGVWLDPNSTGYELHQNKKFKELDEHIQKCSKNKGE